MYSSIHFNAKPRAVTNASKPEVVERLKQIVGAESVLVEPEKVEPYGADTVYSTKMLYHFGGGLINMQTISINELQHNLGKYLEKVKDGDEIIIEDENEVIARISPFDGTDEEQILVSQGFMTLPKKELSDDFWETDAPEVSTEKIVETIRNERDED